MTEIALFPIPNLVSFPGTLVPLHVFEPRYRSLVKDSVRLNRAIGITHTKKLLSHADHSGTMADKLSKNQDSYEPYEVFSAGLCEIKDVTGDGRLIAEVKMEKRYLLGDLIQEIPYQVYECAEYKDLPEEKDSDLKNLELKNKIDKFLIDSVGEKELQLIELLASDSWRSLPLSNYSFSVFQLLKFDPKIMQQILELRTVGGRLRLAGKEIGLETHSF